MTVTAAAILLLLSIIGIVLSAVFMKQKKDPLHCGNDHLHHTYRCIRGLYRAHDFTCRRGSKYAALDVINQNAYFYISTLHINGDIKNTG